MSTNQLLYLNGQTKGGVMVTTGELKYKNGNPKTPVIPKMKMIHKFKKRIFHKGLILDPGKN